MIKHSSEFVEAFPGHVIYSIGNLYSGYDQFQLAMDRLKHHYNVDTNRTSPDVYATTRSGELGRTYHEWNEQGASGLHSRDNDAVLR